MVVNFFKKITGIRLLLIIFLLFFITGIISHTQALGSATIFLDPNNGNLEVAKESNIDIKIDGGGQTFNAAKATIVVSKNLLVKNLTFGDCNFAFVTTPTIQDPSFVGVILGDSSRKCTVYRLTVEPISSGNASVLFTNCSVKSFDRSTEIFSAAISGNYLINPSSSNQSPSVNSQSQNTNQNYQQLVEPSSYSLALNITDESGKEIGGATVTLAYQVLDKNNSLKTYVKESDQNGNVEFSGIEKGVYKMTATFNKKVLSEKVFNIGGTNPKIAIGVRKDQKTPDIKFLFIASIALFLLIFIIVIFYFFYDKYKEDSAEIELK